MKRHGTRRSTRRTTWRLITAGLTAAVAACGSSTTGTTTATTVTAASPEVAQTALGSVGYEEVGSGPPLLLIMGYAGTMQTWEPQLVDALARRYRVVIFDNAGIARTSAPRPPLTVDAMANQTSALITALGLGKTDVLGWSMGGMIAQALAVLHPAQVRRLVLCASFPGVAATIPPQAKIDDLTNGNGLSVLFPADQPMAAAAFSAQSQTVADPEAASAAVIAAQGQAALAWFHAADPAGRETSQITAPTLVADGAEDQLDAVSNARAIARLIPGARLLLYPDAGHGFLFQEGAPFTVTVESFLSGPVRRTSAAAIRTEFTAGDAAVIAAGRRWLSELKGVSTPPAWSGIGGAGPAAHPTVAEVDAIDQPFASSIADLDARLLADDASGPLGATIAAFATADERLATDVLALPGVSGQITATWAPTIKADSAAEQRAKAALERALGLPAAR